ESPPVCADESTAAADRARTHPEPTTGETVPRSEASECGRHRVCRSFACERSGRESETHRRSIPHAPTARLAPQTTDCCHSFPRQPATVPAENDKNVPLRRCR